MLQWFPLGPSVSKLGPWPRHAHQRSMETPLLLNWQTPSLRRIQIDTDTHTHGTERQTRLCECVREYVRHTHTHTYTHTGSPMVSVADSKALLTEISFVHPRGQSHFCPICLFSLFPLLLFHTFSPCPVRLSSLPPHPLVCSSSPGWPSVTSTPCLEWLSLSGWLWCLACRRRTSSAVSSWGSFHFWWSRPPRTSWVFGYFFKIPVHTQDTQDCHFCTLKMSTTIFLSFWSSTQRKTHKRYSFSVPPTHTHTF